MKYITDQIKEAIGDEKDDYKACGLNVKAGVAAIRKALDESEEEGLEDVDVLGAIYNIESGKVDWL